MTSLDMRRHLDGSSAPPVMPMNFDQLYQAQWWPMLRLAVGLVSQLSVAEDVVQDAFASVYRNWLSIREPTAAVGYLRTAVVNGSRNALRGRITARKYVRVLGELRG